MTDTDQVRLIGLDWGTSSLRAYSMGHNGMVLARRTLPLGVMRIRSGDTEQDRALIFEAALQEACGDWLEIVPHVPVIACGMVGSAQGWREVPYAISPMPLDELGKRLTPVMTGSKRTVFLVPGLIQHAGHIDVMRGEETQLVGSASIISSKSTEDTTLVGLPGTHSKWALLSANSIQSFETFMTGEIYEVLRNHTIIGRTMKGEGDSHSAAFDDGLRVATLATSRRSVLSTVFSTRSLTLTGYLAATDQADYLSGLLIGEEVAAVVRDFGQQELPAAKRPPSIFLVGDDLLCARYQRALRYVGCESAGIITDASARGLWQLAALAGIVSRFCQRKELAC